MFKRFFLVLCIPLFFVASQAFSLSEDKEDGDHIYINVGEAKIKKSLLAFPPLLFESTPSLNPDFKAKGSELYNTAFNDLDITNLFNFVKQEAYLEDVTKAGLKPTATGEGGFQFENWEKIGAEFLLKAGYKITPEKKLELEAYLYSVTQKKVVLGKKYSSETKDIRQTAHTLADDIVKALTGKKGIFKTKLAVASDKGGNKWKEIYIMDWDGRNMVGVTNHRSISMSPSWSPTGKTIAYTSFAYHPKLKSRNADLFTYDIFEGKRYLVSSRRGLNSGSTFSGDGQFIYLTLSQNSDPDIYKMTLEGDNITRLTYGPKGTLNVEPSVSRADGRIAFSSDRAGNPMIYVMNSDGSSPKRLTFAGKYNSSPSFSPDGKKIAFAGRDKGHFDIFVMNDDGTGMIRLTSAKKPGGAWADNEDPSFSPDGRYVVYTSNRTGKNQIYISTVDGTMEKRITGDSFNYFKPRWSPHLD